MRSYRSRDRVIDLVRILAIIGVISLHVFGAVSSGTINSDLKFFIRMIYTIIYCSVNIFALISGYLYVGKKIHIKSLVHIYTITFFWCIVITIVAKILCGTLGVKELVSYLFPYSIDRLWYITCYTFCFAMIPLMNFIIEKLSKKEFRRLLIALFLLLSVLSSFTFGDRFHIVSNGYSGIWLCYMFLWGGYFKKYGVLKLGGSKSMFWVLFNCIIMLLSAYSIERILGENSNKVLTFYMYSSPFIVANSLIFFSYIIDKFKSPHFSRGVYWLSSVSLGVYIIHAHPFILDRVLTYNNISKLLQPTNSIIWIWDSIWLIVIIFLVCGLLEEIRRCMFKIFKIEDKIEKISNKMMVIFNKMEVKIEERFDDV